MSVSGMIVSQRDENLNVYKFKIEAQKSFCFKYNLHLSRKQRNRLMLRKINKKNRYFQPGKSTTTLRVRKEKKKKVTKQTNVRISCFSDQEAARVGNPPIKGIRIKTDIPSLFWQKVTRLATLFFFSSTPVLDAIYVSWPGGPHSCLQLTSEYDNNKT